MRAKLGRSPSEQSAKRRLQINATAACLPFPDRRWAGSVARGTGPAVEPSQPPAMSAPSRGRTQFRPGHGGIDLPAAREGAEPAIRTGDDAFGADDARAPPS